MEQRISIKPRSPEPVQNGASARHKQQGITLIVALIMLTVLTLIGVTVANMTTVDLKIVANQQASNRARAAAESGIDFLVNNPTRLLQMAPFSYVNSPTELNGGLGENGDLIINETDARDWSARVRVSRMGDPLPCPPSLTASSVTLSRCVYFEITSTGRSSKGSTRVIKRGFYRKVGGSSTG